MEDACPLSSNAIIAADKYVVREDPEESTRALTSLLRKVMQEDGTTWEVTWKS
jgi:hypothetical protein